MATRAACLTSSAFFIMALGLATLAAVAQQTAQAQQAEPMPAPATTPAPPATTPAPPASTPAPPASTPAPPASPSPLPTPPPGSAFIPQGPVIQHRERGNLVFDGIPPADPALAARLERYQQSRGATFLDWLADGTLLVSTRFGDTEQVHRVSAPLGMREQLTFYGDPIEWARGAKSGRGFAFLKDHAGDDNAQVYYQAGTGEARQLTHGSFIHGSIVWAHDGKRIAFYGNDRDSLSYDVYVADVSTGAAPQLVVGGREDTWYPLDWSPDDSKLLVWRYFSSSESYLYLADVATGALTPLQQKPVKAGIRTAKFDPAGRGVYVLTDEDSEFAQLRYQDLITHESRLVTPDVSWDVEDFDVSGDGRYIAYVLNEDGRSRLALLDRESHRTLAPAGLPEGRIGNPRFDRTGHRLAMTADSATSPRDVWVYDLEKDSTTRWTQSEAGPIDTTTLVAPELVRYPTWDRVAGHERRLSAYVYRSARAAGPVPVVIDIHGGPEAQYRPEWDPFVQFLVNELGCAVVAPNVRGSSGYGKSFLALDNGTLREDAVRDIGSLLVWIGVQPGFDRDHVVVMGGSYGGYLALAALVTYGDRLRGGIDLAGISNFVTFLRSTSGYRRDWRRSEYGDERDPNMRAFLERISPLSNATHIRKPVLVAAGQNDPRVPISESEQLVWRVRSGGGEVWYLVAKDEGHGFLKKANRDEYLLTAASFLQKMAH
ncbi:MAG TPA: prolyl oligopeptidase family serine peptidase [Steroidobacteraceae bacterium]|nr:prolyl oligopeptidase family serine peptidase [Steroidobacteraceae bacterium]